MRLDSTNGMTDRDTPSTSLPLPLHLRLPRQQRTSHRLKPTDADAMRTRHLQGLIRPHKQRRQVQMSVLSGRIESFAGEEGVLVE
jgi:hypothetical protein